ncbi:MAG: zinc ribbon domain-containing protein [Hyphomicrobiaceae bacterium]
MAGDGFSGLWRDNGGWRFAPAISPDYILEIADEALGLHGTEDVAQTAHEWTATGLFTLAAALDTIRLRHLGEWIYRQPPSAQPFTLQDLNDQLRLGLENADPRWSVAMLAAVLPAGTFSIATNLAGGLSELADAGGFVEYADRQKTRWIPGGQLQELAVEWFAPISALLLESVVLGKAGVPIARDGCALVRGQGPLILLDFGRVVRGETAAKVAMTRVEPEQSYVRLHTALVSPAAVVETNKADSGDGETHSPNGQNVGEARNSHNDESSETRTSSANVTGADLNKVPEAELGKAVAPTIAAPPVRNRYCTQCRTPLRAIAAFCTSCGTAAISP